jgi:hypothetical protein
MLSFSGIPGHLWSVSSVIETAGYKSEAAGGCSMPRCIRLALVVTVLTALEACIPIPYEADVSVTASNDMSAAADPLEPQDAIMILGPATSDHDFPNCVEEALTEIAAKTHVVPPATFRAAAGGNLGAQLDDAKIGEALRDATTQQTVAQLRVRYLVFIQGTTETVEYPLPNADAPLRIQHDTEIKARIWDAPAARHLGDLEAKANGIAEYGLTYFAAIISWAPTESKACNKMAQEIQRVLLTHKAGA